MAGAVFHSYADAYRGLPRSVWLLACVLLVNRCGTMVMPFLAIYLTQERGYDPHSAGRLLAICGSGGVIGSYVGGRLTARFGPLPIILAVLAATGPIYLLIPYCEGVAPLMAALFARQLVAETMRPAVSTATTLFASEERHAQALALNRLANNLGCSIGPVIGGLLAGIDFFWLFPVNAAFTAAAAIAVVFFFRGGRWVDPTLRSPSPSRATGATNPWRDNAYVAFLGLFGVSAVVFFQLMTTVPLYWREQCGYSELAIGLLFAVNTLLVVLLEMPLTNRVRRCTPLTLVGVGAALYGVGFGLTPFGVSFALAAMLVGVLTFGEMLSAPFSAAYAASRSGRAGRAQYMGAYATTLSAASVVAPLVGMGLYQFEPTLPWWLCLVVAPASGLGLLCLGRRRAAEPSVSPA